MTVTMATQAPKFPDILPSDLTGDVTSCLDQCLASVHERQADLRSQLAEAINCALTEGGPQTALTQLASAAESRALVQQEQGGTHDESAAFEVRAADMASELVSTQQYVKDLENQATVQRLCAHLDERTAEFQAALDAGKMEDAAFSVVALRKELDDLTAEHNSTDTSSGAVDGSAPSLEQVSQTHEGLRLQLVERLSQLLADAVYYYQFVPGSAVLQVFSDFASLKLWEAADLVLETDNLLTVLNENLVAFVVTQLVYADPPVILDPSNATADDGNDYAMLTPVSYTHNDTDEPPTPESALATLVTFLQNTVFCGDLDLVQRSMEILWPACASVCTETLCAEGITNSALQLRIHTAKAVERGMQLGELLRPNGVAWHAFASMMARQEGALLQELQITDLLEARGLCRGFAEWPEDGEQTLELVGSPWEGEAGLGSWGNHCVLSRGQIVVWRCAKQLCQLLQQVILRLDVTSSDFQVAAACKTLEDAVSMYRALVVGSSKALTSSRRFLIHSNSARLLSDTFAMLPAALPPTLHCYSAVQHVCLSAGADIAATADDLLTTLIRKQSLKVRKGLQSLPPLQSLDGSQGIVARRAVQTAVTSIRSCSEFLSQTCGARVHTLVLSAILSSACEFVEHKICGMKDIGAADSEEIPRIFAPLWTDVLTESAQHLIQPTSSKYPPKAASLPSYSLGQAVDMLCQMCPPVRKAQMLGQLLNGRLAFIVDSWLDGTLVQAQFTRKQVTALILALFEDTDFRKTCLQRIRA